MTLLGVVSDTHGTLHSRLLPSLREARVDAILHAGDVGDCNIIRQLEEIAPVTAVKGNIDLQGEVSQLPEYVYIEMGSAGIYMTHIGGKPDHWLAQLPEPKPRVAICGHSHAALLQELGGVLFLNPGVAGTRPRFGKPLTFALLHMTDQGARAEIITL